MDRRTFVTVHRGDIRIDALVTARGTGIGTFEVLTEAIGVAGPQLGALNVENTVRVTREDGLDSQYRPARWAFRAIDRTTAYFQSLDEGMEAVGREAAEATYLRVRYPEAFGALDRARIATPATVAAVARELVELRQPLAEEGDR